jgi:hypothetical protein
MKTIIYNLILVLKVILALILSLLTSALIITIITIIALWFTDISEDGILLYFSFLTGMNYCIFSNLLIKEKLELYSIIQYSDYYNQTTNFTSKKKALLKFKELLESDPHSNIILGTTTETESFGEGSRGEWYGLNIIDSHLPDSDDDEQDEEEQ